MFLIFGIIGGILYRIRGGAKPSLPRPIDQALFALPLALMAQPAWHWLPGWAAFVVPWALITWAVVKGHGSYMPLGRRDFGDDESIRPLTRFLSPFKNTGDWTYQAIGLGLSGALVALPMLDLTLFIYFFMAKILAYEIGWRWHRKFAANRAVWRWLFSTEKPHLIKATAWGEFLTGFLFYTSLDISAILMVIHTY